MSRISKFGLYLLICAVFSLVIYLYSRPVPTIFPTSYIKSPPITLAVNLPWPSVGQAALGAQGYGLLEVNDTSSPMPIASVAKVITALAVLQKKPILPGSQGPAITIDSKDVDFYNYYLSQNGSVAKVATGESITEYQALEAMMLPSANNMADSLVRWAFGTPSVYISYADQMLKDGGLNKTIVADASGFGDNTNSTADDLVKIGIATLQNPVLSKIVAEPSAQLPVAGLVYNVNWLLGSDGVVGIKTGNTDIAGGCYLVAAKHQIDGQSITLVSAILGAPDLNSAITSAQKIIKAADNGFKKITVMPQSEVVGSYKASWGSAAQIITAKPANLLVWQGKDITIKNNLKPLAAPVSAGATVGSIGIQSTGQSVQIPIVIKSKLSSPSLIWRIFRH